MSLSFSIRLFYCSRRVRIKPLRTEEMNDLEEVVAFIRDTKRRIRASSHWKKSQPRKEMESYLTHKEQLISPHDQAFIFVSWNFKKTEKVNKGEYRYWAKKKFFACIISREYLKWEGGGVSPYLPPSNWHHQYQQISLLITFFFLSSCRSLNIPGTYLRKKLTSNTSWFKWGLYKLQFLICIMPHVIFHQSIFFVTTCRIIRAISDRDIFMSTSQFIVNLRKDSSLCDPIPSCFPKSLRSRCFRLGL